MKTYYTFLFVFALTLLFILLIFSLSFLNNTDNLDKGSPFECGFQPFSFLGMIFSMPFFFVSLVFLLFDVEILLICLFPFSFYFDIMMSSVIYFVIFLIFFSTLYEWRKGVLSWI